MKINNQAYKSSGKPLNLANRKHVSSSSQAARQTHTPRKDTKDMLEVLQSYLFLCFVFVCTVEAVGIITLSVS